MNIAFIGGGVNSAIGKTHYSASTMDNMFNVVAGCFSRDSEVNLATGEAYGVDKNRVYSDYKEMLEKEHKNLDAVVVLLPTNTHCQTICDCLDYNIPVISEKSLALSSCECNVIIDKVESTQGFCCVTYNYTGYPMMRYLKEQISKGSLGKIKRVVIEMPQEGFIRLNKNGQKPHPQEWRLQDYVVPTISLDLGSHLHNMIAYLTNEKPIKVLSEERSIGFFDGVIDDVTAIIEYTGDMLVNMWFSKAALGNRNGLNIRVFGDKASANWYQMEPEKLVICSNSGEIKTIDRSLIEEDFYERFKPGHPAGFIEAFANYYQEMYKLINSYKASGKRESSTVLGLEKSREGLLLFEAAHRSHQNKGWEYI